MKKIISICLAMLILCTISFPAGAEGEVRSDSEAAERSREGAVSKSVIEQIYENHANDRIAVQDAEEQDAFNTDVIYTELSRLYLEMEQAEKEFQAVQSEEAKETLLRLVEKKNFLESQLTSQGHIFLTQEEVNAVFGITSVSPMLDSPTSPINTKNHRFVLSPTYSTTANGKTLKFYYVTATPQSTSSTMHKSYNIDIMKNGYATKFIGSLIEVYASKITGAIVAAVSVPLSWAPYEILSYSPNSTAKSDYQIRASFTSTPRFVWAGYEDDSMYYHEGSFHSTDVSEVHTIVSVVNGRTITDTKQKSFVETTEHFNNVREFIKWQYEKGSSMVLEKNKFTYYFEEKNGKRTECASQIAPYAADYSYLN